MKKLLLLVTTLLISLSSVFAFFESDTLTLTCAVNGYTRVGFTEESIVGSESFEIVNALDKNVHNMQTINVYSSVISTSSDKLNITLELPKCMTSTSSTDTIGINYTYNISNSTKVSNESNINVTYSLDKSNTIRRDSQLISLTLDDASNVKEGNYSASLKLTVTSEE